MSNVFVVTKQGVYRHEICGIFKLLKDARKCATKCITDEHDDYHDFHIYELETEVQLYVDEDRDFWDNQDVLLETYQREGDMIYQEVIHEQD